MEEFILKLEELPILLNILSFTNNEIFRLHSYLIGTDLFKVILEEEARIDLLLSKEVYQKKIENICELSEIIPSFEFIRSSLIGAGFWEMEGWVEVKNQLEKIKNTNPLRGDRISLIGLDTNCFINRIYSHIRQIYKELVSRFGFLLSKIIQAELKKMNKVTNEAIMTLRDKLGHLNEILNEFWNEDTLSTRLKHVGLVEYNKLRAQSNYKINDGVLIDTRERDLQIIEDFDNQIVKKNCDLVLLSSDKQFFEQARGPGIKSYFLKLPSFEQMPDRFSGTWEQVCDFLYLLSIYFGAISLRAKDIIQIFGIWKGKTEYHWDSESIKIRIGSLRLSKLLKQQINIITLSK